ncbi:MAG: T9SS type A sorting domain-containing protein [Flavobacteriales bacterium]|nr:T9SS type A sorting domain-containing protein [Flavobacteriales bacterium]
MLGMVRKLNVMLLHLLFAASLVCEAQVETFFVRPVQTHPGYDPLEDSSAVSRNTQMQDGRLFLFIGGTWSSSSTEYNALRLFSAGIGLDFINLSYPNDVATASLADETDTLVFDKYRQELCFGTPLSDAVEVDSLNAIHERALNLLRYLDLTYPTQDWGQYLAGPDALDWSRIVVGGHSQGSGHACYLAKQFPVERVLMFSGPNDYSDVHLNAAHWLRQPGVTLVERHFSYLSLNDEAVPYAKQYIVIDGLGMLANDDSTHVDGMTSPYGNSHCLYTTQLPGLVLLDHNVPVMYTATNASVWTYMLTSAIFTGLHEEIIATDVVVRPNPARSTVEVLVPLTSGLGAYTLRDQLGRTVLQGPVPTAERFILDISGLGTGLYLLEVNGSVVRVVKQ